MLVYTDIDRIQIEDVLAGKSPVSPCPSPVRGVY